MDNADCIDNFNKLNNYLKKYNFNINPDIIIELINKNEIFNNMVIKIFKKYQKQIVSGKYENLFDNELLLLTIETYCMINNIEMLQTLLKSTLNEVAEYKNKVRELKLSNELLEKEILKKDELIKEKETQRRKSVGKVSSLKKKLNKMADDKVGLNEIVKSLCKDNVELKNMVKTN